MERIINGVTYNTETAKKIAIYDNGLVGASKARRSTEKLFMTSRGNFFLQCEGGVKTRWAGGADILPLSREEALDWMKKCGLRRLIEKYFSDLVVDG